jgi:hypothetical protein
MQTLSPSSHVAWTGKNSGSRKALCASAETSGRTLCLFFVKGSCFETVGGGVRKKNQERGTSVETRGGDGSVGKVSREKRRRERTSPASSLIKGL